MRKQPSPYGKCHRCQSPVKIPGLEAFKCSVCGWMPRPATRIISANSSDPHQPVAVISFVPQIEQTLLDLIGQREVSHV